MTKLTLLLLKYPFLKTILSCFIVVSYSILLNPSIAFAEWFNWTQYTDDEDNTPYPFDTWSTAYDIDNPSHVSPNDLCLEPVNNNPSLETVNVYDQTQVEGDTDLRKHIEGNVEGLIAFSKQGLSHPEIIDALPSYKDESYQLPKDMHYIHTYEYQLLEAELLRTKDLNLIKVISVLTVNYLIHNNYPNMSYEHYLSIIEQSIQAYVDKLAELPAEEQIRDTIEMPKSNDIRDIPRISLESLIPEPVSNKELGSESPIPPDYGDDEELLTEYYGYAVNNPDMALKDVEKIFPNVFENPDSYALPEGVNYVDLTIYESLYELSKESLTIRHILVIQLANHDIANNYDVTAMDSTELITIRQKLIVKYFRELNNRDKND